MKVIPNEILMTNTISMILNVAVYCNDIMNIPRKK